VGARGVVGLPPAGAPDLRLPSDDGGVHAAAALDKSASGRSGTSWSRKPAGPVHPLRKQVSPLFRAILSLQPVNWSASPWLSKVSQQRSI